MMLPQGNAAADTGTLVVMSEAQPAMPTPVGISLPAVCGPVVGWCPVPPSPLGLCVVPVSVGNPALVNVCSGAQVIGTGIFANSVISVVGPAGEIPQLHVVLKFNSSATVPSTFDSDDAFLAIPTSAWSTSYRALGYVGQSVNTPSRYAVVSDGNANLVTQNCAGATSPPFLLPTGSVFQQTCLPDISGRRIISGGQKFAVVSGSACSDVPVGAPPCDVLMDMLPPTVTSGGISWPGNDYFTTEFSKSFRAFIPGDLYRIMALENPVLITAIQAAGAGVVRTEPSAGFGCTIPLPVGGLLIPPGGYCDVSIGSPNSGVFNGGRIQSSGERFMVGHYMKGVTQTGTGDSSMEWLVPAERFRCAHRFFSFTGFNNNPATPGVVNGTYVNIVARTAIIPLIQFDDGPLPSNCVAEALPGPGGYSWLLCRLPNPCTTFPFVTCPFGEEHTLTAPEGIGVYAYGQSFPAGAYAYATGFTIPQ